VKFRKVVNELHCDCSQRFPCLPPPVSFPPPDPISMQLRVLIQVSNSPFKSAGWLTRDAAAVRPTRHVISVCTKGDPS